MLFIIKQNSVLAVEVFSFLTIILQHSTIMTYFSSEQAATATATLVSLLSLGYDVVIVPQTQPVQRAGPDNRWTLPLFYDDGPLDLLWRCF